jgi:hypothetical protein
MMRNKGVKKGGSKKQGNVCWNTELLQVRKNATSKRFKSVQKAILVCYREAWDEMSKALDATKSGIRGMCTIVPIDSVN